VSEVSMMKTPLGQILAVTRFAQRAVGVDRVVAAGNCLGAQAALALAAETVECVGAICILPRVLRSGGVRGMVDRASRGRARALVRSSKLLRRTLSRTLGGFDWETRQAVLEPLPRALQHARVVFVYDQVDLASRSRAFPRVHAVVDRLPPEERERFELKVLPVWGLERFATMECQEATLEALVEWVDRALPSPGAQSISHPVTASGIEDASRPA
jgi:hypothetical protein